MRQKAARKQGYGWSQNSLLFLSKPRRTWTFPRGLSSALNPGVLRLSVPQRELLPFVLDSPHSGLDMPPSFHPMCSPLDVRQGEDSYVDELFGAAPAKGATLLAALFPRSFIDVNRTPKDIHPLQVNGIWPGELQPSDKARNGLGLIRQFIEPGLQVQGPLSVEEIQRRIDKYYVPYHTMLKDTIDTLHRRHGFVFHIDCHSMKSVGNAMTPDGAKQRPDFVLGNKYGKTCSNEITHKVAGWLREMGYTVHVNDPYAGAHIVDIYGRPEEGRHSLQIEVKRNLYMNEATREKTSGFGILQANLTRLIDKIVEEIVRPQISQKRNETEVSQIHRAIPKKATSTA